MKALDFPRAMTPLRNEIDRMLERFWDEWPDAVRAGEFQPAIDVTETPEALAIKVEVPGMAAGDIQVRLQDNLLVLQGEKREEKENRGARWYRRECRYGTFMRTVMLPNAVDADRATANFKDGVLMIQLPKAAVPKGRDIPVRPAA